MYDEFVPKRKRGRPFARYSMEDVMSPSGPMRANTPRCRQCPKCANGCRWCTVSARPVSPDSVACRYGRALIRAAERRGKRGRDFPS